MSETPLLWLIPGLPLLGAAIAFAFTRRPIHGFPPAEVGETRVAIP